MNLLYISFVAFLVLCGLECHAVKSTVPFRLLMGENSISHTKPWKNFSDKDIHSLEKRQHIFETYYPRLFQKKGAVPRIPKKLHLIWIGPHPFPEKSKKNIKLWKALHPDWNLIFWTDCHKKECPIKGMKKCVIDKKRLKKEFPHIASLYYKTKNLGEKSDLLRYNILYNEGGIYVDHDCKPLRSFDDFLYPFDFFAGTEFTRFHKHLNMYLTISNSIIGARARHPIFNQTMKAIRQVWQSIEERYPENTISDQFERVIARTFDCFSKTAQKLAFAAFLSTDNLKSIDIIFPTSFFFANNHYSQEMKNKLFEDGYIFSTHQYAGLWLEE